MSVSTQISKKGDVMTIRTPQKFDFSIHQVLRKAYEGESALKNFIVDLSNTSYMDSSALGMLLQLKEHVGKSPQSVKLINATPNIKEILMIANFDKLMTID